MSDDICGLGVLAGPAPNQALEEFARRFLEEAPALLELVQAASELDNPNLSGNGEDVMNELVIMAEEAVGGVE